MKRIAISLFSSIALFAAEPSVQSNVVYAMYSGTALLMDIHRPAPGAANGYGIIHVSGSGWTAPMAYSATELKLTATDVPAFSRAKPLPPATPRPAHATD
mgnify:CR=1 FL=1